MANPNLPREKWHFSSGRPRIRNKAMEPMESMYEAKSATVPRAVNWLKAMEEPKEMLIRAMGKTVEAMIALRGISQPGRT